MGGDSVVDVFPKTISGPVHICRHCVTKGAQYRTSSLKTVFAFPPSPLSRDNQFSSRGIIVIVSYCRHSPLERGERMSARNGRGREGRHFLAAVEKIRFSNYVLPFLPSHPSLLRARRGGATGPFVVGMEPRERWGKS